MPSNSRHGMLNRPISNFELRTYDQYIKSLNPYLWFKFNESSGTTVINYGSGGTGLNGTFTTGSGSVAQVGQFGLQSAYSFDGLSSGSKVNVPNNSAYSNASAFTVVALLNPTGSGLSNTGTVYEFDNGNNKMLYSASASLFHMRRPTSTTNPQIITNSGQVPINGVWQFIIGKYNDTTDRKVHVYRGYKNRLIEFTYGTNTTGTGTLSSESNSLNIGNNSTSAQTWSGLFGNFLWFNRDVPLYQLMTIIKLAKV